MTIEELLEVSPVIPAIKNDISLEKAIASDSEIVFVIMANLLNIESIVNSLKEAGKKVFIHVDMIEGLSSSNYGVEYIVEKIQPFGIITTKHNIVSFAVKMKVPVIQRFFILDSFSYEKTLLHIQENKPTAVEILPGLMPKILYSLSTKIDRPLITGGLIASKEDIVSALSAGACAVSTTDTELWNI
ncbi:MAG: glycerol-3-phosphate responsive antiterminator [Fusobacterium necrophorum]|nr:glycerol-3-phosphate responsive antiterminator [Fusobacterium necrophorum]